MYKRLKQHKNRYESDPTRWEFTQTWADMMVKIENIEAELERNENVVAGENLELGNNMHINNESEIDPEQNSSSTSIEPSSDPIRDYLKDANQDIIRPGKTRDDTTSSENATNRIENANNQNDNNDALQRGIFWTRDESSDDEPDRMDAQFSDSTVSETDDDFTFEFQIGPNDQLAQEVENEIEGRKERLLLSCIISNLK